MPRMLIRVETDHGERFLEWSTVVDAPVSYGMTEAELREWHVQEYGRISAEHELEGRIERCRAKGTSSYVKDSVEHVIAFNRAGPNGSRLTLPEIIAKYCPAPAPDDGGTDDE